MKGAGFSKVYGGGVRTAARQTGASEEAMARAFAECDRLYPEIKRESRRWQRKAYEFGMVFVSATGRRLPLDRDRTYAVVNYACRSVARDCLGQALLNIEEAGLLDMLKLPIHDEVLLSAPREDVRDVACAIEKAMTFDLYGVPIEATAETGGRSWGSLYGSDF
ncbi:DNA polymerase [Streptomyces liangshanensis]|uniref:DNA polymerase n=1 Tax=Streptomyces liangshanensis TaxID=2717324 RepID=UPI001AAF77E8|nr:DNA polymerase [Streptomyces liangshanensis]